jgi:cytoskeletal protein RodZ
LRDIRVGESPSRPWGIPVPVKYLEKVQGNVSEASSQPARIPSSSMPAPQADKIVESEMEMKMKEAGKARCPFGFDQPSKPEKTATAQPVAQPKKEDGELNEAQPKPTVEKMSPQVAFITPDAANGTEQKAETVPGVAKEQSRMVFTGPVFIGYSAEDAAKILRESGLGQT